MLFFRLVYKSLKKVAIIFTYILKVLLKKLQGKQCFIRIGLKF